MENAENTRLPLKPRFDEVSLREIDQQMVKDFAKELSGLTIEKYLQQKKKIKQ